MAEINCIIKWESIQRNNNYYNVIYFGDSKIVHLEIYANQKKKVRPVVTLYTYYSLDGDILDMKSEKTDILPNIIYNDYVPYFNMDFDFNAFEDVKKLMVEYRREHNLKIILNDDE